MATRTTAWAGIDIGKTSHWICAVDAEGRLTTVVDADGLTSIGGVYAVGDVVAPSGSAIVYWDSGNPTPPNGNVPPWYLGQDPHSDPRKDDVALLMKQRFFETGQIVDVHAGAPYWTPNCPRHPEQNPGC